MNHSEDSSFAVGDSPVGDLATGVFATTHWSIVLAAGRQDDAGAAALEQLCRAYWYPIYAFVRRRGSDPHDAKDLTQAFFGQLLEKETLKKADRQKGKFRSFLLAALTNFLANEWDKGRTLKRGGQRRFISLDDTDAEELYRGDSALAMNPESLFERRWALALVEQVFARLRQEYAASADRLKLFAKLEAGLTREVPPALYAEWAASLGMSEGAVRVALLRLRRRFGEVLRREVAQTVSTPEEVDGEIRHLFAAIAG